jgi:predicted SnoaL-like aldol condensation-catalyzing enzyme
MTGSDAGAAYVRFYESLTRDTVGELARHVADDIHFKDPFNDVRGRAAYERLLVRMFDAVPDIKFVVTHRAVAGDVCFIRWRSVGTLPRLGSAPWVIEGASELRFSDDGRVREHIDHWDAAAQFYERLPIVGPILRFIRRRVAAHSS